MERRELFGWSYSRTLSKRQVTIPCAKGCVLLANFWQHYSFIFVLLAKLCYLSRISIKSNLLLPCRSRKNLWQNCGVTDWQNIRNSHSDGTKSTFKTS